MKRLNCKFGHVRFLPLAIILLLISRLVLPNSAIAQGSSNEIPFSIKQVLSAPFPSNLTVAPNPAKVAWVQNAEGVRNIWIAEGPEYKGKQLTNYQADDGREIGSIQFTPDDQGLVYVRGSGPNRQGELPNPLSLPEGAQQVILFISTEGDSVRQIAEGSSPAVSPKGNLICFLRRRQVWSAPLEKDGKAKQLFKIRGRAGSLRWSPDGSMLAFVSSRGDHSFIGVYTLADTTLRYLDPSVDRDGNPVWSPDGSRIAFIRTPNQRQRLPFQPRRSALPW
ncbi:MAG: TolB family protein, partial [Planctomycetota bacterium]